MPMVAIPGFEGYFIDDSGRVYSARRERLREMTPFESGPDKRLYVKLTVEGRGGKKRAKTMAVGELQLLAARKERPPCSVVAYLDGEPRNNSVGNVVWQSRGEHARQNRKRPYRRDKSPRMTSAKVRLIRSLRAGGASVSSLVARFKCSRIAMYRIIRHESWAHVT